MKHDIVVPAAGESVTEADIASWSKGNGDWVELDDVLLELETDKASMELNAEHSGVLTIIKDEGETVPVGCVIGQIETNGAKPTASAVNKQTESPPVLAHDSLPVTQGDDSKLVDSFAKGHPSPAAAKAISERSLKVTDISGSGPGGRILKQDVPETPTPSSPTMAVEPIVESQAEQSNAARSTKREKMSRLRRTISNRLVEAQQTAALLTTFNEVDMGAVMAIRKSYKEAFKDQYNVGLGFMSFFTKAACDALKEFPILNASVDNESILFHNYCDIGIAVSTPKGLVVPVIRNAESLSFNQIEQTILDYALKGRSNSLTPDDMSGGTFTITNGGTFGSMLSTPIVNRPQSAILGMHNIVQRPVVKDGEIVIRPIMYLAVTYDHRIIDGADAVRFLVAIKNKIEDPTRLLIGL